MNPVSVFFDKAKWQVVHQVDTYFLGWVLRDTFLFITCFNSANDFARDNSKQAWKSYLKMSDSN